MTPPKHLWTGAWREESEADAQRRHEEAAHAATRLSPATGSPAPPAAGGRRRALIAAAAVTAGLAVTGGVFAIDALNDNGTHHHNAAEAVQPAPLPAAPSTPVTPAHGQTRAGTIYAQASPAVVSIRTGGGSGTGFLVDRHGTLVTNEHVVDTARHVQVRFGTDGRTIDGVVRGTDPSSDLAVVHIDPSATPADARPLRFADSDNVTVGDTAIAIGNPFGLDRTATEGIVSSLGRTIEAPNHFQIDDVIQTDAAINPGNSGGPLLDAGGLVMGVTSQIATSGGGNGNVGIGFAVPSNTVRRVLPRLEQGQTVSHAWLGVETSGPAGTSSGGGPVIARVVPGGPAQRAGLQPGDQVTAVNGRLLNDPTDLSSAINARTAGDTVKLTILRNGQKQTINVQLQEQPPAQTP